jgi:glucose/mannose transport system permease protein
LANPPSAAPSARLAEAAPHAASARIGVYAFLVTAALLFLLPLYVMLATSIKPMEEIRLGNLFALPVQDHARAVGAGVDVGLHRPRVRRHPHRLHELGAIVVPSTVLSILLGALNGYALSFWRPRGAQSCSSFC